jgi:hypothetical protein
MSRKQTLGVHISNVNRQIAKHLHRGEEVPEGLARHLGALRLKEQRGRFGQLRNMRRRGSCDETAAHSHAAGLRPLLKIPCRSEQVEGSSCCFAG